MFFVRDLEQFQGVREYKIDGKKKHRNMYVTKIMFKLQY